MNICTICGKGSVKGGKRSFLRSHYNPTASVRKHPNLQWGKLGDSQADRMIGRPGTRAKMCAKCLKTRSRAQA